MSADQDGSVGKDGGWAATEGPQGFYWGGTWITAAAGTDNPTLVADIIPDKPPQPVSPVAARTHPYQTESASQYELTHSPS